MMEENRKIKRKISRSAYIAVFCFVLLIFLLGILAGDWIAGLKSKELDKNQQKLTLELTGLELKDRLVNQKDICSLTWQDIWQEKVQLGTQINALESKFGKENEDVLFQKEIYELIEIRTMLLLEEMKLTCSQNISIILFFYTNNKDDPLGNWEACEDQGYILTQLGRDLNNTHVFSFDINVDNPAVNTLKNNYKIQKVPALVINGNFSDYKTLEEIKKII
jgi:hypothetical protein